MEKTDKNFAFYVSGSASRLKKIINKNYSIVNDIKLVVSDNKPQDELSFLLAKVNIPFLEINYAEQRLKGKEKNEFISKFLLNNLTRYKIDYVFCFGNRILIGNLLSEYKNRIINFHPSILPMYPGQNSIDEALKKQSFLLGNTAHFIDEGIDTGPIIMQNILSATVFKDYDNVLDEQIKMLNQIYVWLKEDRIEVNDSKVEILDADYSNSFFIPNLEITND